MNIIFYLIIFIMGSLIGSFLTLATYRIPLNQDITYERSYCPKCGHKLGFLDLIPIFSYIFLGGKCRYCKTKISKRYITIEITSGILAVLLGLCLRLDIYDLNLLSVYDFWISILYIVLLYLTAVIDIEHREIDTRVLSYGVRNICYRCYF